MASVPFAPEQGVTKGSKTKQSTDETPKRVEDMSIAELLTEMAQNMSLRVVTRQIEISDARYALRILSVKDDPGRRRQTETQLQASLDRNPNFRVWLEQKMPKRCGLVGLTQLSPESNRLLMATYEIKTGICKGYLLRLNFELASPTAATAA